MTRPSRTATAPSSAIVRRRASLSALTLALCTFSLFTSPVWARHSRRIYSSARSRGRGRGPPQARDGRPLQAGRRLQPFQIPAQPEEVRYDPCGQVALGAANGQRGKEHLRRTDDFGPVLGEHPHVLGGRATRQTAGQRVFIGQRPGEPAAHHLPPHAIEYEEEAKDDPARLEPLLTYTGRHRRRKQGAGRELPGELVDAGGEFLLPAVGEPRGRDRRHAAVERRTDQPFAEITRDDAARPLVAEP